MQLLLLDDTHIRLDVDGEGDLAIEGGALSALHLLAGSLAVCTAAVLREYAATAQFVLQPFTLDVRWHYAERPHRVQRFTMRLLLGPHVPPSRHDALVRAAEHCTVHQTLSHGSVVDTQLEVRGAQQA